MSAILVSGFKEHSKTKDLSDGRKLHALDEMSAQYRGSHSVKPLS